MFVWSLFKKQSGMGLPPELKEVRAERDVLQARMSEQALRISSLSARLAAQRHHAAALASRATSALTVALHDARAEVQRLSEELECRDKQLARLKLTLEEKVNNTDRHQSLYGNSCNPQDKVVILERELSAAQSELASLQQTAADLRRERQELRRALRDREDQMHELLALNLEDVQNENKSEAEGKVSARTLSDIVSISEFDEQDLQMRRAEVRQNLSLSGAPYPNESRDKTFNRTLPPDIHKANISSLNLEYIDHFDVPHLTPRADSLPTHLTSTQNKDAINYKRNVNETTVFGDKLHSTKIADNCSMYPNKDASDNKNVTVEPKKIDFSLEASNDNKTNEEEFTSLRELGVTLDIRQENFPDILSQLKHEIKKSRKELEDCRSELKKSEEQLCEFPALKEEVDKLKNILENTMATMDNDKKYYENQLDNFSSNKKLLEQRLSELSQEFTEKTQDIHLLKEDLLRRENMILELAKEKRNLTNRMAELEVKIDELQTRNHVLESCETENHQMKEKLSELTKLEQLVTEKNQQIDSLNQHLDRLDDLQRRLNDKTEQFENLKEAFEEKSNEIFQLQDTIDAQNRDMVKLNEDNDNLNIHHKDLKQQLTKLEKEQENASIKLQNSEAELERVNSLNNELTSKIENMKLLTDTLKDKETEIEILKEDINAFHEEIATLKDQMKMVSRSPSPRSKGVEGKKVDRQASNDKKQLVKIRKQISMLQHELDFNKKELNDKAYELAKAKLDVTELRNNLSQAQAAAAERDRLRAEIQHLSSRMREEGELSELRSKLRDREERCEELQRELAELREAVDREQQSPLAESRALLPRRTRSPTASLERALRDTLHYSHTLDEHIMEQILSASSDERDDEPVPRLALDSSKSSSVHSSTSDRVDRLRGENEKLQLQLQNISARLKDKDALITELNRIRDKLVQDWQSAKQLYEAERDNSGRLQLLLDTHKETAEALQKQDSSMIEMLKSRLEAGMRSEMQLQQREQQLRARLASLQEPPAPGSRLQAEMETTARLSGEISVLKSKMERERSRADDASALLHQTKNNLQRELDQKTQVANSLREQLADLKRARHEATVELVRSQELAYHQGCTIAQLETKINSPVLIAEHDTAYKADMEEQKALLQELESLRQSAKAATLQDPRDSSLIRYLHGRVIRLESWRKALVWQKRYLQRVVAGYAQLERALKLTDPPPTAKASFRRAATAALAVSRMQFLVRRRHAVPVLRTDRVGPHSPAWGGAWSPRAPLARRPPAAPASPALAEFARRLPFSSSSPRDEPFILNSSRGETAAAYLNKLEVVSRCLSRAVDVTHDTP